MNDNHFGKRYHCSVCSTPFTMIECLIEDVELKHECGEELVVTIVQCPNCESMSIPEGMNQIAWLIEDIENEQ